MVQINVKAIMLETTEARYNAAVQHVVDKLLSMAHEVSKERIGDSQCLTPDDITHCAGRVIHAVTWGIANANLDDVVIYAAQVEQARKRG